MPSNLIKGVPMKGFILCHKCRSRMLRPVCACGSEKAIVGIYWESKHYEFRRDDRGEVFVYRDAQKRLVEINSAIQKGRFNPTDFLEKPIDYRRFDEQIAKWLNGKERAERSNELSYDTLKDYRGYVNNHFKFLNSYDVREIGLEQLSDFKDTLDGVSIKTRKNIMNALRNFFFWLKERGVISEMPVFPKIKGDDARMKVAIDFELQTQVLEKIPAHHKDVLQFLMETGLRPGEVCALLCEHIDPKNALMRVERTFTGSRIRETTKQKRKRIAPLSETAYGIATRHMKDKLPKQYLFINPKTKRNYCPKTLWRIWKANSKLGDITLYEGTRHSFGSQLIEDHDIYFVKELMGHADIRTTQAYLHMKVTKLRQILNQRGRVTPMANRSEIEASPRTKNP
jgi:integrase